MFDGLLQSKFHNKTKTALKTTRIRLEAIKKKRAAVERCLAKDIADLLKNGLRSDAFGRAEGLLVEQNVTRCYDFIDQFCRCISSCHFLTMPNQSECPEECREAVASLMQAAARFADLPELRDLRTLFREKYGNSVAAFINKEFAERLKTKPHSKDAKLQLMRDIAVEFSVDCNLKIFDQKLFNQNQPKPADDNREKKPSCPSKERERSKKDSNSYLTRKVLGEEKGKLTSSGVEHHVATDKKACKRNVSKQSLGSSSSPADADVKKNRSSSYREITPHMKSKSGACRHDGVDCVQDMPRPKSVRHRKLKQPPGHESKPREVDEEEKMMDRLLLHYSKKQSPYEMDKFRGSLKPPHSRAQGQGQEEVERPAAVRPSSLRLEPVTPTDATDSSKGHCRSASLPPQMLAGHVHPNLPNYSDLVERLATLRGQ
ncbi:hypothetical protein MLD38_004888 [Melastoma candidum]|uniref:Uncharacterized protein n=1 Tax=Melastoma candidum TaxID=119954 RepID=A0ACB9SAF3_9MYRT|nr:hypothetical protein MLD38_004888 [Melastoma candidum]